MKIRTAAALMVSLGMASSAVAASFSYSGPPVPIPEAADLSGANPGAQVGAPITVSGLTQPVGKVVISIDGTACTDAPGATTVGIDHTFVSDLVLTLRAPDGTEVVIGQWADGGGNNLCQVVFDDAEAAATDRSVGQCAIHRPLPALFASFRFCGKAGQWDMDLAGARLLQ